MTTPQTELHQELVIHFGNPVPQLSIAAERLLSKMIARVELQLAAGEPVYREVDNLKKLTWRWAARAKDPSLAAVASKAWWQVSSLQLELQ